MRKDFDFVNTKYDHSRFLLQSPHSFLRFTKPRMRLKTPRLLVKVRNQPPRHRGDEGRKKFISQKWADSGNLLQAKIGLVFCACSRKPAELASSGARKMNVLKELVADRLRTVSTNGDHTVGNQILSEGRNEAKMGNSHSFKKILGIKDKNSRREAKIQEDNLMKSRCFNLRFPGLSKLKKKKTGFIFRFRKWRITRTTSSTNNFAKIPRRPKGYIQIHSPKIIRRRTPRKAKEDSEQIELCKKRILMGEKCKPLNISGSLHYDKNGVLLPEMLQFD